MIRICAYFLLVDYPGKLLFRLKCLLNEKVGCHNKGVWIRNKGIMNTDPPLPPPHILGKRIQGKVFKGISSCGTWCLLFLKVLPSFSPDYSVMAWLFYKCQICRFGYQLYYLYLLYFILRTAKGQWFAAEYESKIWFCLKHGWEEGSNELCSCL